MRNIFTRLLVVSLLLLVTATVSAQLASLEVGKVYRFVNARTAGRSLNGCGSGKVNTTTTDANDLKQQWYVTKDGDYYVLRNLYYAQYLKGAESLYTAWTMTDDYSATQNKFELVTSNSTLNTLKIKGSDTYGHMHDSNNGGHNDGYSVVKWLNDDSGSYWTIHEVTYSNEELKTILDAHPTVAEVAAWATNFRSFFNDDACTTSSYATLELAKAAAEYSSLSADLQALVDEIYTKVLSDNWEEDNAVDGKDSWGSEYAKKFRVQMYEPYSIAGDITSWLGINAHANNDNPTGIHVPEAGTLYVMVEGTIKDGASLRIVDGGHNWRVTNATSGGYALKPGLNVINYTGTAGQLYICYNVDTYNPDGATTAEKFPHKLSEYPPLKIHIEGGAITGYYNACGDFRAADSGTEDLWKTITGASVDNDADWKYMETRANLNVIPLLSHRQILLFHLNDYTHEDGGTSKGMAYYLPDELNVPTTPYNRTKNWADYGMECDPSTGKINIMLEAWDRIMYSELATMGLVSKDEMDKMNDLYPRWKADGSRAEMYDFNESSVVDGKTYQEFCNGLDYSEYFNHHGVALGTESGYMYGGWDHCGYNITTYNGIVQNMANNAGSTWGPAHEIGHQHQAPLTLNGLTEVTNNLFSNIALWYKGMSTSRYNGNDGSLERVLNAYNTEGSDIYTNNIWALTHLYYRLWLYYHLAGKNTQFWPRLYELLRQQPMQKGYNVSGDVSTLHFYKLACQAAGEDLTEFFRAHGYFSIMDDRLVGDYSNSVYEVSQEMIDEAIAEVKEMGYEENLAIILICDDVYTTIDGKKYAAHYQHDGTTLREIYGETSPNSDFGAVSDFINGNVSVKTTYTATLNSDATLTMSGGEGGVGFLVLNEDGEIVSFSNKSTFAISDEAAYLLATGKASVVAVDTESTTTEAEVDVTAMRFALLQELIENAIALTQNTSEIRVGFYKSSAVKNLQEYVTMAQEVIANGDLANLQAVYELLYNEYNAVVANEFSRVTFVPGSKYAIINKGVARIMSAADGYVTTVAAGSDYENTAANQWYLERDVAFRLKNAGTNTYAQEVTDQNGIRFTVAADVVDYNIIETSLGWYSLACSRVPSRYMNMNGANTNQVITWGSMGDDNSQWKFILLEADDTNTAKEELLELSKKTLALVNEVATVSYNEGSKISLQSSSSTTANYIWSNAAVSGNDVDKLLDSDKNTFFHSQWNNSTAPADGWGHHISVDLGASSTLTSFKFKFTTRNQSNLSNYPKTIEVYGSNVGGNDVANYTKLQAASGFATGAGVDNEVVVMGNGTAYRYLRFLVTDATGNNSGTNTGSDGMVFFHMSEFSIYPVTVSATVKSDYTSGVTVDAVLAAYNDAEQGKTVYNNASATLADINAKKTALGDGTAAGSYTTLLAQYNNVLNSVINAKKAQLLTLITNTNNLIKTVGSVEFIDVPLALTTENLYCNDPCLRNDTDYSADYVSKLTDGVHSTFMHTDWDNSNSAGSAPHYLRVDMGEGETITQFKFSYTTRDNGNNCPTTIVVEGSNDAGGNGTYTTITTLTKDANGLPVEYETFNSETITSTVPYRYIRFRVAATESGDSFFVMSEFSFTKANQPVVTMTNTSTKADEALVFDTYLATAKSQKLHNDATTVALLDAAIADQQAAYDKLNEAMQKVTCDKAALQTAYEEALELYNKMADAEGNVTTNYAPSTLTIEQLAAAKTALDAAKDKLDNSAVQDEIDTAKGNLETAFAPLNTVESLNVAATKDKSILETLINDASTLLGTINGNIENNENYYAGADGLALAELQYAHAAAVDAKDRYYLTEEQYNNVYNTLNSCYTATNAVVSADVAKDELNRLITTMEDLLATTTVSGAQTAGSLPLQVTDKTESFYILTYPRATDDNGKGAIIDETDGVGNTGTFIGTYWQSSSEAYSHYVEIDLGVNTVIEDFSIDYTTRYSGADDSRPTGLKFYGSNDKETYTELFSVTEGLPTTENTKWEMSAPHELAKNYRYIRVAVASKRGGCFNMSDFNLYSHCTATVNQDYSTSNIFDCLPAALREYCDAKEAAGKYLVADDCTAAKEQLEAQIGAIQDVIDSNLNERAGLETLANETNALVTKVAAINEAETAIIMQCTNENAPYYLYCNAAGKGNDGADALGVAALVGDKAANTEHLHTAYQGSTDDDLDHYLRLDMGENKAMMSFKFSYTGRNDRNNSDPKVMLIEGSNDLENFEPIAKLTDLPSSSTPTTYTSDVLGNGKAYRYIRFMVIKTNNNAMYKEHPFFVLSQFAVTAYKTIEVNSEYASKLPMTTLVTANNEVEEAGVVVNQSYVTQDAYDNAYAELAAAKAALEIATAADKTELKELIAATTALKSQLYKQTYTQGSALALQADDAEQAYYLYCNAPESNAGANDNVGVKALIDSDETNYLHTEWTGEQSADGLDHYLRVDLGEDGKLSDFVFSYKSARDLPRTFVVEGCNTADGEYERIGLYVGANTINTLITSGLLGNGNKYRYLRFRVIATQSNKKDNSGYHRFFVLNDFDVYPATITGVSSELKDEYASTIYIYNTSELVTEVTNGIIQAQSIVDDASVNQGDVDAEVETLQAVYDKLAEALLYATVPVTITTDEANPVLYNIISKRATDDSKVLQYCEFDATNPKTVSVSDKIANNSYQAWYFMESAYGVVIKPFNGDGKVLGADDTDNGHTKVWAVEEDEKPYYEWNFVISTDGYYNIQVYDGSSYLSNYAGTGNKIGFYASNPAGDPGSLFKFVEAEFENDNARYYQLSDFENTLEYRTATTPEGTTVGAFVNGGAYSTAYSAASDLITAGNTSDATACKDAYTALRTASESVARIEPEEGKIYRIYITPGYTDSDRAGASMRIDDNGKLYCDTYAESNARFYFTFEYDDDGNLYMKNLHTGTYLDEALTNTNNKNVQVGADAEDIANAKKIAINTLGKSGAAVVVGIVPDGGNMLNCAGKPGNVVAFDNNNVDKASAWVIEEVEPTTLEEKVKHTISLAANTTGNETIKKYSTLCLGYPVTLPAESDVKAYIASGIDDNNVIELVPVVNDGKTIPANTPVILKSDGGVSSVTATFTADAVSSVDETTNLLGGSNYTTYVSCLNEQGENVANVYMLTRKNGLIAMRWMYENYKLENGAYTQVENTASDDGGYVKCPANKAYLKLDAATSNLSTEYYFGFFGGATDIDEVNTEENLLDGTIFDLQGRKIEEVTVPGFYIVNGKKMYVDTDMLK